MLKVSSKQGDQIGRFFGNWATFKVSKWFDVDVLGFQIKLGCSYFGFLATFYPRLARYFIQFLAIESHST